jgi:hypothetical protein
MIVGWVATGALASTAGVLAVFAFGNESGLSKALGGHLRRADGELPLDG